MTRQNEINVPKDKHRGIAELIHGSSWVFLSFVLGWTAEYANKIIIARVFGKSGYGTISLALSLSIMFMSLSLLGLNIGATRYIAIFSNKGEKEQARSVVITGLTIILPLSIIVSITLFLGRDFIVSRVFKGQPVSILLLPFLILVPFAAMAEFFRSCLRGLKLAPQATLARDVLRRIVVLIVIAMTLMFFEKNLLHVSLAYLAGHVCYMVVSGILVARNFPGGRSDRNIDFKPKNFILFSLPLLFSFILKQFGAQMASIFLAFYRDTSEVGLFAAALPFGRFLNLPLMIVLFMFLPLSTELLHSKQYDRVKELFNVVCNWLFIPSGLIFALLLIYAKPIIYHTFGPDFLSTNRVFIIISMGYFIGTICGPTGTLLLAGGHSKEFFLGDLICVIFGAVCNIIFIPRFGFMAAAWVFASQMILLHMVRIVYVYRFFKLLPLNNSKLVALILLAIEICLFKFIDFPVNIWVEILLIVLTYIGITFVSGILDANSISFGVQLIRKQINRTDK